MTPTPSRDVIINVYLPIVGVSLGYVTVGAYWQDAAPTIDPRWKQPAAAPLTKWILNRPPQREGN